MTDTHPRPASVDWDAVADRLFINAAGLFADDLVDIITKAIKESVESDTPDDLVNDSIASAKGSPRYFLSTVSDIVERRLTEARAEACYARIRRRNDERAQAEEKIG